MSDFMHWVTHGIKRGRFEVSRRTVVAVLALAVVLTLVAALYLMLVSQTAARGRHIEQLQAELARLQRENAQLEVQIAREGSVSRLIQRAYELGFVPAEQVDYLHPAVGGP
jgi:cell division protein FtsL